MSRVWFIDALAIAAHTGVVFGQPVQPAGSPPASPPATTTPTGAAPADPAADGPLVPFPHPLITEVLYAVPTGPGGDANKDGSRDAAGDEFVELVNPHDKPIQLRGYALRDRNEEKKGGLRFRFPAMELKPGQVVVVFNGCKAKWKGPVGDSTRPPTHGHDSFRGAFVFTMRASSTRHSFANDGDWVLLTGPGAQLIQCVRWGEFDEQPPATPMVVEDAPQVVGESVQRGSVSGALEPHPADHGDFSPGVWPLPTETAPEPVEPEPPVQPKPPTVPTPKPPG